MSKWFSRWLLNPIALIVATLNVEKVTQGQGADSWLDTILERGPEWLRGCHWLLTQRPMLFLAGLYLGAAFNNWLIGLHGRFTGRHGRVPLWSIRRRMQLVRRIIDDRALTAIADLARELSTLNGELTAPGMAFPALPTTDPHAAADMTIVKTYVTTVAPLLKGRSLPQARTLAEAVVRHRIG